MDKFGLIGNGLQGSGSPALFEVGYHGSYTYDLIDESSFEKAWNRFLEGYKGVNVTAPFKQDAFLMADIPGKECLEAGACNILVKSPEGIRAYNSDFLAVRQMLSDPGTRGKVLVVGFGGSGKAAAAASRSLGLETVVCNRTPIEGTLPLSEIPSIEADALIYTLPCPIPQIRSVKCSTVIEANYKTPSFNAEELKERGINYISGKEWLRLQAKLGYALLTGEQPDL